MVYVPANYTGAKKVPLHFTWHGLGDSCDNFIQATGFEPFADSNDFLLIVPCAMNGLLGAAWNAGTCCLQPTTVDDVAFARGMVDYMSQNCAVDNSRIWASGFSNGAMMSEILACNASDIFTAVASVSGCVELEPGNDAGLALCDSNFAAANKQVNVLQIHGDADLVVPWTGDALLGFPPTPQDMDDWATRNSCSNTTVQTLNVGTFTNQVWEQCKGGINVELVKNAGGSHEWPSATGFDTTTYIVDFFAKHGTRQLMNL